jgi:hypothetical protein
MADISFHSIKIFVEVSKIWKKGKRVLYIQLFQLRLSPEQSGKVEYERERLLGIANKWMNLLAIPSSLSRSYSTFPLCSGDSLNWNSCIPTELIAHSLLNFPIYNPFNPLRISKPFSCHGHYTRNIPHFETAITRRLEEITVLKYQLEPWPFPNSMMCILLNSRFINYLTPGVYQCHFFYSQCNYPKYTPCIFKLQ